MSTITGYSAWRVGWVSTITGYSAWKVGWGEYYYWIVCMESGMG